MEECQNRIHILVEQAKKEAGLDKDLTLKTLVRFSLKWLDISFAL